MKEDTTITIDDTENRIKYFPFFIRRIFLKAYYNQGFVYLERNDQPIECSDVIKWLDVIRVITTSQKRADKLSWDYLNKKYPHYKPYIQLF